MLERVIVFVFSVLMVVGSLGGAVWLVATGQTAHVDGLFLLLVLLVFAASFAAALFSMIKTAMETAAAAPQTAKPAAPAQAKTAAGRPETAKPASV